MKKIDVKKCLLYISLLPYLYVIIMGIYYAIFGYDYGLQGVEPVYGIRAGFGFLDEFWEYNFFFNFVTLLICVAYQTYYLVTCKRKEQKSDNENAGKMKNKIGVKKILFVISILCWIVYLMTGLYAFFAGTNGGLLNVTKIYGIEALGETLFWNGLAFSIIPVLPITLIYIVVYIVFEIREKRKSKLNVNKER